MAHYNLYETLHLNPYLDANSLAQSIEELKQADTLTNPGGMEELNIALAVIGNEYRKSIYDSKLQDPEAAEIGIPALRQLANMPVPAQSEPLAEQAPATNSSPTSSPSTDNDANHAWAQPHTAGAAANMPVTMSYVSEAPQLPENAGVRTMWQRMPTIIRVPAILSGVSVVSCYLMLITSVFSLLAGGSSLSSSRFGSIDSITDLENAVSGVISTGISGVMTPLICLLGIVIIAIETWWIHIMMSSKPRISPALISVQAFPIGISMLSVGLFLIDVGFGWLGFLGLVVGLCSLATGIIVLTKQPRLWFQGQVVISRLADRSM